MMKVEGTEEVTESTKDGDSKICDETEETLDPSKTVKNEEENNESQAVPDENTVVNNGNTTNPSENELEMPNIPKVEDTSEDTTGDNTETPNSVENKCENLLNNKKPLEDTKSPFKICRLCLVFVDDSFIPLEKVMVMLQIVLPEVVSKRLLTIYNVFHYWC